MDEKDNSKAKSVGRNVDSLSWMPTIPFLAMSTNPPKLSGTRILEALIIAAVTAFATSYITVAKLETKTEVQYEAAQRQFERQVQRRDMEMSQIRGDMKEQYMKQQIQYEALRADMQRISLTLAKR